MLRPPGDREIRESAFEIKFVVDQDTGQRIRERARTLLAADPWASGPAADEYTITSLYFDTHDLAVFNRTLNDGEVKQLFELKDGVRSLRP